MSINEPATIMIFAAMISTLLSLYAWRKRQNSTGVYLSFLLLSSSIWSLFYGLEIFNSDIITMKLYLFISYFGIASLPVFWLLFASRYTGIDRWVNPFSSLMIFIPPIISMIMISTNQYHYLFYKSVSVGNIENIHFLKLESGPFWWINIIYSHILIVTGLVMFIRMLFKSGKGQRVHILFFIIAAFIPYVVNIFYITGFRPYGFLDLTPVAFIIMGFIIIAGVFAVKLFDINPLAVDLFFKNTPDIIFVRNSKGSIVNSNPAAQELFGSIAANKNLKVNAENSQFLNTLLLNDKPVITELKIFGKYYEKTITRINNRNGKNMGTLTMLRDISKAKEAQEEIEKLANLQNLLMRMASKYINLKMEEMEDGISQSLFEMGTYANADRAYIFQYNWEDYTCSNTYEWCADGISKKIEHLQNVSLSSLPDWVMAHKKGEPLIVPDIYLLSKDSSLRKILEPQGIKSLITIPVMQNYHCHGFIGFDFVKKYHFIKDYEKTLLSVYADILVNLLERVKLENNLVNEKVNANAANKAKSEFLANMSHEIRTPMNSILGFAEVMLNTTSDKQQKNYLNTILESGKSLLSLINDILDLSKIEAGRMEILPEPTDLRILIKEMENLFFHKMKEKNIVFKSEIDPKFPEAIIIDELRIRQVLLNLVGNAVKFTEHGYVKVQFITDKKIKDVIDFEIKVIDTGIGIEGGNYQYLFDAFIQQSGQNSRKYGGTGLGLAITKRLVELMNGKIEVESEPGRGSCFSVKFQGIKITEKMNPKQEDFAWNNKLFSFRGAKILIVDDIQHNRMLVTTYLNRYNVELIEAENGEDAVEKCISQMPDLVFMDIRMPRMDGYEATKLIKNNPKTASIPIVALTASTMNDELQKVNEIFNGYIRKPVHKQVLINEVLKFLPYEEINNGNKENEIKIHAQPEQNDEISYELKKQFRNEFSLKISTFNESIIIDDLSELTSRIKNFSHVHKIQQLEIITEELNSHLEEFDFDKIKYDLKQIKNMFGL